MANGAIMNQKKANPQLSNLTNPQQSLYNIGAGVRQNLLINPFFKVNQRGESLYAINTPQYTVDCWKTTGSTSAGSVGVQSGYVQVYNTNGVIGLGQFIENYSSLAGLTVTLSFLVEITAGYFQISINDGTQTYNSSVLDSGDSGLCYLTATLSSSPTQLQCFIQSTIANANIKIYSAKLEVGNGQSLAYQDVNGDWNLLEQPDPNEILKCYRYQYVPMDGDNSYPLGYGFAFGATSARMVFPCGVKMRLAPTVTFLDGTSLSGISIFNNGAFHTPTAVSGTRNLPGGVGVIFTTSGLLANDVCSLRSTSAKLLFDANL